MASDFLSVANFTRYQHKDALRKGGRGMLFVRLNVGTRLRPEFTGRGGRERYAQWIYILEWAGETLNKIPSTPSAWRREFGSSGSTIRDNWVACGQLVRWEPTADEGSSLDTDSTLTRQSFDSDSTVARHSLDKDSAQPSGSEQKPPGQTPRLDEDEDLDEERTPNEGDELLKKKLDELGIAKSLQTKALDHPDATWEAIKASANARNSAAFVTAAIKKLATNADGDRPAIVECYWPDGRYNVSPSGLQTCADQGCQGCRDYLERAHIDDTPAATADQIPF